MDCVHANSIPRANNITTTTTPLSPPAPRESIQESRNSKSSFASFHRDLNEATEILFPHFNFLVNKHNHLNDLLL
ncbi:hypothetical protein L1887_13519 [Cichorium endivia]|nr:hypothetical protein L1887_13519 [Cichorium endivia]